ncbi:MAG: response regulator [Bacteroidales bacterium]|nr:response regulator [Bacteroidales bacterium]
MKKIFAILSLIIFSVVSYAQSYKLLTTNEGLSSSLINKVTQDKDGLIWIATENGLNCFDGNKIKVYRHENGNINSLAHNFIRDVFVDSKGIIYVGTYNGFQIYNPLTDSFSKPATRLDGTNYNYSIMSFTELHDGTILALGDSPCSIKIDSLGNPISMPFILPGNNKVANLDYLIEDSSHNLFASDITASIMKITESSVRRYNNDENKIASRTFFLDSLGTLLACSLDNSILKYDNKLDTFTYIIRPQIKSEASYFCCSSFGNNKILAGTDGNGLKLINLEKGTIEHYSLSIPELDDQKIKVHSIFIDKSKNLWLGLFQKGVLVLPTYKTIFNYIGHKSATNNIIGQSGVSAICFCNNLLWVATDNDGIYIIDPKTKQQIKHLNGNNFPELIMSLFPIDNKYVYVGTYGRGLWKIDAQNFDYHNIPLINENSDTDYSRVSQIKQLTNDRLIFSTMGGGVGFLNINNDKQEFYKNINTSTNHWAGCITPLGTTGFATGTYNGIYFVENYNAKQVFKHMFERTIIFSLLTISKDKIVAGTSEGLFIIKNNNITNTYESLHIDLPTTSAIYSLEKDNLNNIWAGTDDGIYCITLFGNNDYKIKNYSVIDGTVNEEFTKNAVCKSENGFLFFGGFDGITYFKPEDTRKNLRENNGVKITRFYLRNRSVNPIDTTFSNQITKLPTWKSKEYDLLYNQNSFSLEFTPIDFFSSPNTEYYYQVNNEQPCMIAQHNRQLIFPRLNPDVYNISIYSSTNGIASDKYTIKVTIHPAWYSTTLAKIIYTIVILSIILLIIVLIHRHILTKQQILKHIHTQESDKAKLRFFTNVIHEIRTPLSLIVGPLQKIVATNSDKNNKKDLITICKGVDRMHNLVNSLLDIRKIDNGKMVLHLKNYNIEKIIQDNIDIFNSKCESKKIKLTFNNQLPKEFFMVTDSSALEKIITNLLSNAVKFSPSNSEIEIITVTNDDKLSISVIDQGCGINANDISHIFERFYQANSSNVQQGTGIGLDLSKSLAELLHGSLSAQNRTDRTGAIFKLELPMNLIAEVEPIIKTNNEKPKPNKEDDIEAIQDIINQHQDNDTPNIKSVAVKKKIILVEDEPEIAELIIQELDNEYITTFCNNGEKALDEIFNSQPEAVITDLMMPGMDGLALCKKIKQNINLNDIPVIVISAKTDDEANISSLQSGADAFITKPFNIDVLKQTIKNLISIRHQLKVNYKGGQSPENAFSTELQSRSDPDEKLMNKILKAIEKNLGNTEFSTETLALEVGLSRVHLYRKLKELTNQTGSEFIRNIRLKRASELILNKSFSVAQIADMVGFPNTAYFCTAFKNLYGTTPSKWKESQISEEHENNSENANNSNNNENSETKKSE